MPPKSSRPARTISAKSRSVSRMSSASPKSAASLRAPPRRKFSTPKDKNLPQKKAPVRSVSAFVERKTKKIGNRSLTRPITAHPTATKRSRVESFARGRVIRVATDVAVSRLQRWTRAMILQHTTNHKGFLAARIRRVLDMDYSLWKLRVRIAKRVLSEAFNACAVRLSSGTENMHLGKQIRFVSLIAVFVRAKIAMDFVSEKHSALQKRAVNVIEQAWVNSVLFQDLQRLGVDHKMQRLVMQQENIERREYIRRWLLFLIDSHQRFYNHPLLMNSGVAVRPLTLWERVIMDSEASLCETRRSTQWYISDSKLMTILARERARSTIVAITYSDRLPMRCSSSTPFRMSLSQQRSSVNERGEMSFCEPVRAVSEQRPFFRRAEAAFVHGLLHEVGHLDFSSSLGARPCRFEATDNFSDTAPVVTTSSGRLQDVEHASEAVRNSYVRIGGALVPQSLQSLSSLKELHLRTQLREEESQRRHKSEGVATVKADFMSARFIHPVIQRTHPRKTVNALDYTLSVAAMGKTWTEFYRSMDSHEQTPSFETFDWHVMDELPNPLSTNVLLGKGYFFPGGTERSFSTPFSGHSACRSALSICSVHTASSTETAGTRRSMAPKTILGSEFDITYEIERLLICEHNHRLKIYDKEATEISAVEWLLQREREAHEKGERVNVKDADNEIGGLTSPIPVRQISVLS